MTKPKLNPNAPIDLSTLYITDEPFVEGRAAQVSKYETIFSKLPKNQRLVCPSGKAGRIGQSLRDWLAKRGHEAAVVRSKERCDDGKGGVWWLDGERAERPSRVKTTFASDAPGSPFAILGKNCKP